MSDLAHRRWNLEQQDLKDWKEFFETGELDEVLETHGKFRQLFETSSKILQKRIQDENSMEKCANCGTRHDRDHPWYNRETIKDLATGALYNRFACCQACMIALRSKDSVKSTNRGMVHAR